MTTEQLGSRWEPLEGEGRAIRYRGDIKVEEPGFPEDRVGP